MDLSNLLNGVEVQEESNSNSALPAGNYSVTVEGVDPKTNANTGSKGISLKLRVFGQKFNNYCMFDYIMISGSEAATKYSLPKLKKAAVVFGSENTAQWIGKKAMINISVDNKDDTRNIIWSYSDVVLDDNTPISTNTKNNISASELPF